MMDGYLHQISLVGTIFSRDVFGYFWTYFTPFSSVFIVYFEHVNTDWE